MLLFKEGAQEEKKWTVEGEKKGGLNMQSRFKYYLDYLVNQCLKEKEGNGSSESSIRKIRLKYLCSIVTEEVLRLDDTLPIHDYPGSNRLGVLGGSSSRFIIPPLKQVRMPVGIILATSINPDVRSMLLNGDAYERTVVMEAGAGFADKIILAAQLRRPLMLTPSIEETVFWASSRSPLCTINPRSIIFIGNEKEFVLFSMPRLGKGAATMTALDFSTSTIGSGMLVSPFAPLPYSQGAVPMAAGPSPPHFLYPFGPKDHVSVAPAPCGGSDGYFQSMMAMDMNRKGVALPTCPSALRGLDQFYHGFSLPTAGMRGNWEVGGPTGVSSPGVPRKPMPYPFSPYERGLINEQAAKEMVMFCEGLKKPVSPAAFKKFVGRVDPALPTVFAEQGLMPLSKPLSPVAFRESVDKVFSEPPGRSGLHSSGGCVVGLIGSNADAGVLLHVEEDQLVSLTAQPFSESAGSSLRHPSRISAENLRAAVGSRQPRDVNGRLKGKGPGAKNAGYRRDPRPRNQNMQQERFYQEMLGNHALTARQRNYFKELLETSVVERGIAAGAVSLGCSSTDETITSVAAASTVTTATINSPVGAAQAGSVDAVADEDKQSNELFIAELGEELEIDIDVVD